MSPSDPWTPPQYGAPPQYGTPDQYGGQAPLGGQPGYPAAPQPAWGQPAGYGPAGQRGTNTLAILSLVFAFIFAPAAIVLGVMAKRQIRERNEGGSGLATAGIVIGSIFTAISVLVIVLAFVGLAVGSSSGTGV